MNFVKKNLKAIVATFLGIFHFILLSITYLTVISEEMDVLAGLGALLGDDSMTKTYKQNFNGYDCLGDAVNSMKACGFLKVSQILFLIAAIALLLIGAYLLARYLLRDNVDLPGNFGSVSAEKLLSKIHLGYVITSLLTYIATVVFCFANVVDSELMELSTTMKVTLGFGPTFGVLLSVISYIVLKIMEKKGAFSNIDDTVSKTRFICSACGATAKKGSSFCSKCGGQVVEIAPTKPVCTVCGAPAKKGDVFCSKCGGKVEEVAETKPVCEVCGAPAKNGAAFCSLCGGKIVQK